MRRLAPLTVLLALAGAVHAQDADPTPPWSYDPISVGNSRSYVQEGAPAIEPQYSRTDSPTALTIDGQRWVVRRTQRFTRIDFGWSRTEERVLIRYDTTAANVMVRRSESGPAEPLYPCRLDLPLTGDTEQACGDGFFYIKRGDGTLTFITLTSDLDLQAGVGEVEGGTKGNAPIRLVGAVIDGEVLMEEPGAFPDSRLDATPASRYAPMSVGDEWQYATTDFVGRIEQYDRRQILDTRVIDGRTYYGQVSGSFRPGEGDWSYTTETRYARFDTLSARVVNPSGLSLSSCPLDEPLTEPGGEGSVICAEDLWQSAIGGPVVLEIGGDRYETRFRSFPSSFADTGTASLAAGLGSIGAGGFMEPNVAQFLIYARVRQPDGSVLELGRQHAVAADDAPEPGGLALAAGPSPTAGPVTLRLTLPATTAVRWEAFDALGRRVWHRESLEPAGDARAPLDLGDWPAGLYVVRATTGGGAATATVVRR